MDIGIASERTLTHHDHARLERLLARQPAPAGVTALRDLLDAGDLVAPRAAPPTLVTMNTQVLVQDPRGGAPYALTLCYPDDARPAEGRISVLSPLGGSLLGLHAGATARWRSATGQEGAARILAVLFQPEAHGDLVA